MMLFLALAIFLSVMTILYGFKKAVLYPAAIIFALFTLLMIATIIDS